VVANRRHWVIVAPRDHARRGVSGGFVMANHGKGAPLARMSCGDTVLASLREIEPLPLAEIRDHLPVSRIRFGFFELDGQDAEAIWALVADRNR
jgi:hypothetical protein